MIYHSIAIHETVENKVGRTGFEKNITYEQSNTMNFIRKNMKLKRLLGVQTRNFRRCRTRLESAIKKK